MTEEEKPIEIDCEDISYVEMHRSKKQFDTYYLIVHLKTGKTVFLECENVVQAEAALFQITSIMTDHAQ